MKGQVDCALTSLGMDAKGVRRDKASIFQWVRIPPGDRSAGSDRSRSWR